MLTLMLTSALREVFGMQLYKINERALLSHILSILDSDWVQHACSVRGVYECNLLFDSLLCFLLLYQPHFIRQLTRWIGRAIVT